MTTIGPFQFEDIDTRAWIEKRCEVIFNDRVFYINRYIDNVEEFIERDAGPLAINTHMLRYRVLRNCGAAYVSDGIISNLHEYIYKKRFDIASDFLDCKDTGEASQACWRWAVCIQKPVSED